MKAATVSQIKKELQLRSGPELLELCLRLSKFKKENKELLTYLLFEESDEDAFIRGVQEEVEEQFAQINTSSYYYMKKSIRKILSGVKRHIRYSKKKTTEVELLIHFCVVLREFTPSISRNTVLTNIFERQLASVHKAIGGLDEDLQYDYKLELEAAGLMDLE